MHVIVIGGGITGPVAAIALRKAGIEVEVYEAYERTADGVGGWLLISPNGVNALGAIGLADDLRGIGQPNLRMVMRDGGGTQFGTFEEPDQRNPSQQVQRSELHTVLREHATAAGAKIHYGKRLVDVTETANGVTAHFADGSSATGDVLIGADGVRSRVRTAIDPNAPGPRYTGLLCFGGRLPGNNFGLNRGEFNASQGSRGTFGYLLTPEGDTEWFTNVPTADPLTADEVRAIGASQWLRLMRELFCDDYPARDMLDAATPDTMLLLGPMEIMPSVPRWHSDRMVLAGDSVHAPSNSAGQGASLSIESAVELARCLRDLPLPQAFAAYERLRRPRVERVAEYGEKMNQDKVKGTVDPGATDTLEQVFGWLHRHRIEWEDKITAG